MYTEFGEIKILLNGKEVPFKSMELNNYSQFFTVKKRFKLICNVPEQLDGDICIECKIISKSGIMLKSSPESGENLALISFYWEKSKLSIGTKGDTPGIRYHYLDDALQLIAHKELSQVIFYVAWLDMTHPEKEDNYTWFAADPAYDYS